jgi:hypothetical protein
VAPLRDDPNFTPPQMQHVTAGRDFDEAPHRFTRVADVLSSASMPKPANG